MSQRESGYARLERDLYETPEWVTTALLPHLVRRPTRAWEPACASGKMSAALESAGIATLATDIAAVGAGRVDFLTCAKAPPEVDAIITNPPYQLATEFSEHALHLMQPVGGQVAMLLRTDFDHAKGRAHLFGDCPAFAKKLVLRRRIVWFEPAPGTKGKSPSFNHAWFVWDWQHHGAPEIGYAP